MNDRTRANLPLSGVKVLDLSWALTGPAATRVLADFGATVIKVESSERIDPVRVGPPFKDGVPGPERSAEIVNYNAGKLTISLDPSNPVGREIVLRLVRWADIVAEAFRPGVLSKWGLGWEVLHATNPSVILFSTSLYGQTGPESEGRGYGVQGAGQAGFVGPLGWPDRIPSLPGAYTDFIASKFAMVAMLSALEVRRSTGRGQHIDLSQVEAGVQFMAPEILDYQVNGRVIHRDGNRSSSSVPHGVYPCRGDNQWVALSIGSDREWNGLCAVAAAAPWVRDQRYSTFLSRRRHEAELDATLGAWSQSFEAEALAAELQAAGVPAYRVISVYDAQDDPQLEARSHFVDIEYPPFGVVKVENPRIRLVRTPGSAGPARTLGQDNQYVLSEVLGMSDGEIAEAVAAGAIN